MLWLDKRIPLLYEKRAACPDPHLSEAARLTAGCDVRGGWFYTWSVWFHHALAPTEENVDILMLGGKCSSNEQTQLQGLDVVTLKVRKRKNLGEITAIVIFNVTRWLNHDGGRFYSFTFYPQIRGTRRWKTSWCHSLCSFWRWNQISTTSSVSLRWCTCSSDYFLSLSALFLTG